MSLLYADFLWKAKGALICLLCPGVWCLIIILDLLGSLTKRDLFGTLCK